MPKSRIISAARLKPLVVYCAVAFVVVLGLGTVLPPGGARTAGVVAWMVLFPIGGWLVLRRS